MYAGAPIDGSVAAAIHGPAALVLHAVFLRRPLRVATSRVHFVILDSFE